MNRDDLLKTGALTFVEIGHDDDCPGRYTNGEGCTCTPTIRVHRDEARFFRGEATNRAARRKAAREAEKAMRRARRAAP